MIMGPRQTQFFTSTSQPLYDKKKITKLYIEGNNVEEVSQNIYYISSVIKYIIMKVSHQNDTKSTITDNCKTFFIIGKALQI